MRVNNIEKATYILLLAASTIITCVIIWIGFTAMNTGKELASSANEQMAKLNNDIKDNGIMKFDRELVQGSEVINFTKEYLGDYSDGETGEIYISIKTNNSENTYTNGAYIDSFYDFTNKDYYIKPTGLFHGKVIKNINDVILGVEFVQK
ncbi:MAG: hypothetical protein QM644_14960 [Mobilitalea sp.]